MRPTLILLMRLLFATVLSLVGAWWMMNAAMDAAGPNSAEVRVQIAPGSNVRGIAASLSREGVLSHPRLFEISARLGNQATRIQAGEYLLPPHISQRQLLTLLVDGRVLLHAITLVEGWTYHEMIRRLASDEALEDDVSGLDDANVMANLGLAGSHPEGRFFPDTYHVARGTHISALLKLAMQRMDRELDQAWSTRAQALPLEDAYSALILASIVERETALASERPAIAGVFTRRLSKRMRLQTDPTVIYGLGPKFDGNLRRADLERDGPYNTYTRLGLPPTPICLPGRQALQAATQPAAGTALYFVATGEDNGGHYFSSTLEEHNQAVARYLAKLRQKRQESK
ncbi:MAG: endolytic transglycosylase MltG [Gammaproteobacteria bacterium]|nr:endolytic transglycosylase MltG [Gammaproteobacteria bacterium]